MNDDAACFELPAIMKIEDCERLHMFLASASDKDIEINCGAVERLSGLSAQMLVMAARRWPANAREVTFSGRSAGFEEGLALLGLSEVLQPDQVAA